MTVELGIVVPLLEKNANLEKFLEDLALVLIKNSINSEVTIVASDRDFHLGIEKYDVLHKKYLMNLKCLTRGTSKKEYGRIFRIGIANLDARFVALITPDGSCDLNLIPKLLNNSRAGSTLTIVNRFSGTKQERRFGQLKFIQMIFRTIASTLIGKKLPVDSTFAYRMFLKSHYEYLAVSGNSWDMLAEQTLKTLLSNEAVQNVDGFFITPNSKIRFSYAGNVWHYLRVVVRGSMHRLGIPWY